jgi:hypothetical protein
LQAPRASLGETLLHFRCPLLPIIAFYWELHVHSGLLMVFMFTEVLVVSIGSFREKYLKFQLIRVVVIK